MNENTHLSTRRDFLGRVCNLLGTAIAIVLGVPLAGLFLAPLFQQKKSLWVKLGQASTVSKDEPAKFVYSFLKEDAYLQKTERGTVYAVAQNGSEFKVFSNVCTHAGCAVRWDSVSKAFLCPCHNGRFDINGRVIAGPPPKPLNEVEHKVEDGFIFINMKA